MIRRLLGACVGAVFVGVLAVPNGAAAKPPDLPEDGKFTLAPATSEENVLKDVPREIGRKPSSYLGSYFAEGVIYDHDWFDWIVSHWAARHAVNNPPALVEAEPPAISPVEVLPMPQEEPEVTCPYLRQQRNDRHACQHADPEIGRDVMDNLKRLEEADKLLELVQDLANDGCFDEAMQCCEQAADLCPGSPCAARANAVMLELVFGSAPPSQDNEEVAESQSEDAAGSEDVNARVLQLLNQSEDLKQIEEAWERIWADAPISLTKIHQKTAANTEPGVEAMVSGLMKACHLLMGQGMQHQAAELARQAYALDPQRVAADPLVYKMHLLAETQPAGASEASEPPTCPYCPNTGKPIDAIVPKKKKRKVKHTSHMKPLMETVPFEIAINTTSGLRVNAECPLGGNVYHLRYREGSLAIWKTTDASKPVDPRQIEYEWERIWFTDMPSRLTPERIHGGIRP